MKSFGRPILDFLRGALIGAVEVVPGVSGGTVALVVGVYHTLIGSASVIVRAVVGIFRADGRRERVRDVATLPWLRLAAIGAGMLVAIVIAAAVLEPLIDAYPVETRAAFAGLILASLWIPAQMAGGIRRATDWVIFLSVAAVTFWLMSFPPLGETSPSLPVVFLAAAIAVCALVLPGVSGSFLLLTLGLYQPTIAAVNDFNLAYLGVFILGAIAGLGSFVVVLQWLLEHRRRITLLVMTGLMAGSLRALWPWQNDQRELLPIGENLGVVVALVAGGIALIAGLIALERRLQHRLS